MQSFCWWLVLTPHETWFHPWPWHGKHSRVVSPRRFAICSSIWWIFHSRSFSSENWQWGFAAPLLPVPSRGHGYSKQQSTEPSYLPLPWGPSSIFRLPGYPYVELCRSINSSHGEPLSPLPDISLLPWLRWEPIKFQFPFMFWSQFVGKTRKKKTAKPKQYQHMFC